MALKKIKLWKKEKAAIYIRVSTAYQVDKDSLPLQRKLCKSYCEMHGLDYVIFEDAGFTAKSEKRPAYQDMIQRFRNGEFSHLIVYKLDRISRNLLDFMGMYEELESLYVTFISLNENFDTNTAMGKAMLAIMIIFTQMEREIGSERVLSVMIGCAENDRQEVNNGRGLWNGAQTPFGFKFDYDIKYPVPDENELVTLHLIYDMYEVKQSTLLVARYLNQNNIPSKRGGKWTSKVVGDIIKNRFNIGEGKVVSMCEKCGETKEESLPIDPDNHVSVQTKTEDATCTEDGKTKTYCSDCDKVLSEATIQATGHAWGEGTVTKGPTCVAEGEKTYTCEKCGQTQTETLPVDPDNHKNVTTETKDATCTEDGVVVTYCKDCNSVISQETVPSKGHTEVTEHKDPTATEDGYDRVVCSVCGEIISETVLPATGEVKPEENLVFDLIVKDGIATDIVSGTTYPDIMVSGDYMKSGTITLPKSYSNWTYQMIADYNEESSKERTVIMIAHRLKTVRSADQILVLQDGKIVQTVIFSSR